MRKNKQQTIRLLLFISAILVVTFCYIQYALIHNTFELTKDKYYAEVKRSMNEVISRPQINLVADQAQEELKQTVYRYFEHKVQQQQLLHEIEVNTDSLRKKFQQNLLQQLKLIPGLSGVKYKSQVEEIIIATALGSDTLLSAKAPPLLMLGEKFNTSSTLLLNHHETVSVVTTEIKEGPDLLKKDLKLIFRSSNYIDVSDWESTVFNRMLGTFLLGTILIIAVISLLYVVFRTMINQKKIADMKTDFANNITHELKTPLSSIGLILKSIGRSDVKDNTLLMDDLLTSLNRQYIKIQHIVDSVLESAMLTELIVVTAQSNITNFLDLYIHDLKLPVHQLLSDFDREVVLLQTNLGLIEKILNILIENAQKYSQPGQSIVLEAGIQGEFYQIVLKDEGNGIPAQYQSFVFDKFYRIPEDNQHTVNGLGLGLFLAKQAAQQIGAGLILKSKVGDGSTFILTLPL